MRGAAAKGVIDKVADGGAITGACEPIVDAPGLERFGDGGSRRGEGGQEAASDTRDEREQKGDEDDPA